MTIGERIKALRKKNDLTQEKLADYLCVSYQAVSKWECGASCPDLSLIVPLAKLLHVTTDELLGMVSPEADERKREYDALYAKARQPEQLEIAQRAAREYPGELKYIDWQADCLYLLAYTNYTTQEKFYEDLEKALKLNMVVFENATDDKLKNSAIAGIVMILAAQQRHDEAKKYAELYPKSTDLDRATVMGWALTGEEKRIHSQEVLMSHLDGMMRILTSINKRVHPDSIVIEDGLALLAVVGRGMVKAKGTAARVFMAISNAGINIRMIDQGSSELNIIIGVEEHDLEKALTAIYNEFVK